MSNYYRKRKHYKEQIKDIFELISFNDDGYIIEGSNLYKSMDYPYDFDLYEVVKTNKTIEEAKNDAMRLFKNMFREIKKMDNVYFMDFKCGLSKDGEKLRWTPDEIIDGIHKETKIKLIDCLDDKTLTKIDLIAFIDGEYEEFTNIFELRKITPKNFRDAPEIALNEGIKEEIKNGNYYKALKKLYSISRFNKDYKMIEKLNEIFNSDLGKLYLIKNKLNMILELSEKHKLKNENIKSHVQIYKQLLDKVFQYNIKENIFKKLDNIETNKDIKKLKSIIIYIDKKLQSNTKKIINKLKIKI